AVAGDDAAAAFAWVALVRLHGVDQAHPEQAEALYASADAAVLRAQDPPGLRFDLLLARAAVLRGTGRSEEALAMVERGGLVVAAVDPARLPAKPENYQARVQYARALALDELGRHEESITASEKSIAMLIEESGPDHPDVGKALFNLGETFLLVGRTDQAAETFARV